MILLYPYQDSNTRVYPGRRYDMMRRGDDNAERSGAAWAHLHVAARSPAVQGALLWSWAPRRLGRRCAGQGAWQLSARAASTAMLRAPRCCSGRHAAVQGARVVVRAPREVEPPSPLDGGGMPPRSRTSPCRMPSYAMCTRTAPRLAPCTASRSAMKSATLRQGEAMRSLLA